MLNKKFKKAVTAVTMFATVVSLSGLSLLAPLSVSAATTLVDGDIVKSNATNSDGTPALSSLDVYIVKIVGNKKFKRLVLNPNIFASYGHLKWSNLKTVSQAEIDALTTSSLVREDGNDKVYALTPVAGGDTGAKSWINVSAAQFLGLSQSDPDSIYTINSTDSAAYSVKTDITTVAQLSAFYADGTLPAGTVTGDVTASLAATSPAAGTLVAGQANARLADFRLAGNGTVTGITLKRIGISADTTLSNVYLFDGDIRLTDAASVSSGSITFTASSGLFTVNGSKTITVKSDIADSTSGQTVGVELTGVTLQSGAAAGVPVAGSIHSIATATLATVAVGTAEPSSAATTDPEDGVRIWESTFTVGTRNVTFSKLALKQINSLESKDIENFRLLVDGVELDTVASLDADGYVTFSGFEKTLTTGSRNVKVLADIIGGSSRIVQMSLRNKADIDVIDSEYGVPVAVSGAPASTSTLTVNAGTLTVAKSATSPSGNVTKAASGALLAKYDFTAYGEAIKVETLTVGVDVTGTDDEQTLRNVKIMVDGAQVGSTTSVPCVDAYATGTSFTTNFTVQPGTPAVVEIYGDVYDSEGTNDIAAADTIQVALLVGSSNATKTVSLGTLNVPTGEAKAGSVLTVTEGAMTLAATTSYGNQNVVVPQTAYKIGSWTLAGSNTEDINLYSLSVDIDEVTNATLNESDLSNLYIKYADKTTTIKSSAVAANNDWSIDYKLTKNSSITIDLYATVASGATTGDSFKTDLSVSGTGASSSAAVTQSDVDGQTIVAAAGSITATRDAGTPSAAILDDAGTVKTASYKFAAVNDKYTITEVIAAVSSATTVANVILKDGDTVLATKPGATAVTFSGLSVPVNANTSKVLDLYVELSAVGTGAGASGANVTTDFTSGKAIATATGIEAAITDSTSAGNAMYVYKATPSIVNQTLPTTDLATGTQTIAKFTVASNGGEIAWKKFIFTVTKTSTPVLASATLWDASTNTQIAGTAVHTTTGATETSGSISFVATNEQTVNGEKTYVLKAAITGAIAATDSVNTSIAQPTSYVVPDDYTAVATTTASFIWSDISGVGHDATSTTVLDWNNDYLVKTLPTDSQTLQ